MNKSRLIFMLIWITLLTGCGNEKKSIDTTPENDISQNVEQTAEDEKETEELSKEEQDRLFAGKK